MSLGWIPGSGGCFLRAALCICRMRRRVAIKRRSCWRCILRLWWHTAPHVRFARLWFRRFVWMNRFVHMGQIRSNFIWFWRVLLAWIFGPAMLGCQ